jgi:hypothetical protein
MLPGRMLAGCFLLAAPMVFAQVARDVPDPIPGDPVPRDLPGPAAPGGIAPPERMVRPEAPTPEDRDAGVLPRAERTGVIRPEVVPPMPQADVPVERPNTTPVITPPAGAR